MALALSSVSGLDKYDNGMESFTVFQCYDLLSTYLLEEQRANFYHHHCFTSTINDVRSVSSPHTCRLESWLKSRTKQAVKLSILELHARASIMNVNIMHGLVNSDHGVIGCSRKSSYGTRYLILCSIWATTKTAQKMTS